MHLLHIIGDIHYLPNLHSDEHLTGKGFSGVAKTCFHLTPCFRRWPHASPCRANYMYTRPPAGYIGPSRTANFWHAPGRRERWRHHRDQVTRARLGRGDEGVVHARALAGPHHLTTAGPSRSFQSRSSAASPSKSPTAATCRRPGTRARTRRARPRPPSPRAGGPRRPLPSSRSARWGRRARRPRRRRGARRTPPPPRAGTHCSRRR